MMDFSKFRESGDLSDITVVVGTQEYKLHKFPLYARSDYFCELARLKPGEDDESSRVELKDFPGGDEIFGQVADFCYNMSLTLNKNNIVPVRCAAEYLKMVGPGNLKELANKFLEDTITSAKLSRTLATIVNLLVCCKTIGQLAKDVGIVDMCSEALLQCWLRPGLKTAISGSGRTFSKVPFLSKSNESAFTRIRSVASPQLTDRLDKVILESLISLPADWFSTILTKAQMKGVPYEELGSLAVKYISNALDEEQQDDIRTTDEEQTSGRRFEKNQPDSDEEKDVDTHSSDLVQTLSTATANLEERSTPPRYSHLNVDIGLVLDKIVLALPEKAFDIPPVTVGWLTKVLRVATACGCECRGHVVRITAEMLTRLAPEDLGVISPSSLHSIVAECNNPDQEGKSATWQERACKLVDTYMGQVAKKGVLTAETFRLLASATKRYPRVSHDSLFNSLDFVLKSEKDTLSSEQCKELTDLLNFDLLSELSLQKALKDELVPVAVIAVSALQLCCRLRSELASVKYIAEMQEEDIQKYQKVTSDPATAASPPPIVEPGLFQYYSTRERTVDSEPLDGRDNSPVEPLHAEDLNQHHTADPVKAAQSVLTAARHKLSLPIYTGYRPNLLTRLSSPTLGSHALSHPQHSHRGLAEHDISLEEELEFKFDRSFRSLDPRIRHHRFGTQHLTPQSASSHRTYFPYSHYSHRF